MDRLSINTLPLRIIYLLIYQLAGLKIVDRPSSAPKDISIELIFDSVLAMNCDLKDVVNP